MSGPLTGKFPALAYPNFRYFWLGQSVSLIGTWMQTTAQQWLVYTLTKSAFLLGLLGVAQFGPIMVLSLFAGVLVDRYPKKQLLLFTQAALMVQAVALALLVWSGHVLYWEVLVLAALLGLVNTLDNPARLSFLLELVDRKDLRSAIGLNSTIFNIARMLGPALAAVLMARFGIGFLFFINAISFLPVLLGLSLIRPNAAVINRVEKKVLAEILEGLQYIRRSGVLSSAVLLMLAIGTFVWNFNVILPLYAAETLGQGVRGYGFLMSASGAGSVAGALLVASWAKGNPALRLLFGSGLIVSGLLILLNFSGALPLAAALLAVIGFFNIIFNTTANSIVQLNSSNEFRGRALSVYSFAFVGTTPVGNLFAGSITEKFGPGIGFLMCGVASAFTIGLTALNLFLKKRARRAEA